MHPARLAFLVYRVLILLAVSLNVHPPHIQFGVSIKTPKGSLTVKAALLLGPRITTGCFLYASQNIKNAFLVDTESF